MAPLVAIGGLVDVGDGDILRRTNFGLSCRIFASELKIAVPKNAGIGSIQDLRDTNGKVCALAQFTGIVTSLFDDPDLIRAQAAGEAEAQCLGSLGGGAAGACLTGSAGAAGASSHGIIGSGAVPSAAFFSRL